MEIEKGELTHCEAKKKKVWGEKNVKNLNFKNTIWQNQYNIVKLKKKKKNIYIYVCVCVCVCITESLCSTAETGTTL